MLHTGVMLAKLVLRVVVAVPSSYARSLPPGMSSAVKVEIRCSIAVGSQVSPYAANTVEAGAGCRRLGVFSAVGLV
jgi:hypothetical protein